MASKDKRDEVIADQLALAERQNIIAKGVLRPAIEHRSEDELGKRLTECEEVFKKLVENEEILKAGLSKDGRYFEDKIFEKAQATYNVAAQFDILGLISAFLIRL